MGKADMTWECMAGAQTGMIDVYVDSDSAGGQAAAQEHIWRIGDRWRDGHQELVAFSTWPEPQLCRGGEFCNHYGRSRGGLRCKHWRKRWTERCL